jgi:hypothetical protein
MNKGDTVKIIASDERYHIGITANILNIQNGEIKLALHTGKVVIYNDAKCLQVVERHDDVTRYFKRKTNRANAEQRT